MTIEETKTENLLIELGAAVTMHVIDHNKRRRLLEVIAELRRRDAEIAAMLAELEGIQG